MWVPQEAPCLRILTGTVYTAGPHALKQMLSPTGLSWQQEALWGGTHVADLLLEEADDLPLAFHHLDIEVDDSPEGEDGQAGGPGRARMRQGPGQEPALPCSQSPSQAVFGLEVPNLPGTHSSRADARKRKKVFSTR